MQPSVCRTAHRAVTTARFNISVRAFTAETRLCCRSSRKRRGEWKTAPCLLCAAVSLSVCGRDPKGLLAGLWELPSVAGHLSPDELRAVLTEMGWSVRKLLSLRPARHIFTHVEWHMNGVYVELDAPAPLTFVTPAELRDAYALPSAFRSFVSVLED